MNFGNMGAPFDNNNHDDDGEADEDGIINKSNEITKPGPHDVLLGRGGGTNNHFGNVKFRKLVNEHKMRYLACSKVEKPKVAREVVQIWRRMNPPGRFLSRKDESKKGPGSVKDSSNVWLEVGDKKAREKASQCLRERTPDVLPYIKQLRQQQDQLTEQGVSLVQQQLQMQQQVNGGISGDPKLPPAGKVSSAQAFAARRSQVASSIPDRPPPHLSALTNANRRGSLPAVPSSVSSSAIPTIQAPSASRRTSMPPASNLQGSNNLQVHNMNMMQQQQHRLQQQQQHALNMAERSAGFLSPRNTVSERALMLQQQYGVTEMQMAQLNIFNQQGPPLMSPQPQAQMLASHMHTQQQVLSPQPNQVTSFPGRLTGSTNAVQNNRDVGMQQMQMMQHSPQQQHQGIRSQANMMPNSLSLSEDLEPLPYGSRQNVNGGLAVPDMTTSSMPRSHASANISPNVNQSSQRKQPPAAQQQGQQHQASSQQARLPQQQQQQHKRDSKAGMAQQQQQQRTQRGLLKQDDLQPFPMSSKGQGQSTQQKQSTSKKPAATKPAPNNSKSQGLVDTSNNPKAPIPGHVDDGELTLREYRKTLEEFITNNQIGNPSTGEVVRDDDVDDDQSEFLLEGLDTSAWIQHALNNDDSGSDLISSPGSVRIGGSGARRNAHSSGKSLMSSGTSYMSMGFSDMSQTDNDTSINMEQTTHDNKTLDTTFSRETKMSMSRSLHSNQSLMSELTDFSGTEIL